ncbi:MAG: hypothetical protein M1828_000885 [Chrysothrix sp. TS-e1954]|nr:MAG: hypothetical protein M1828_000885 [Chrysothrix sp. TS-e1954]
MSTSRTPSKTPASALVNFPLVVLITLISEAVANALLIQVFGADLGSISQRPQGLSQLAWLGGWKMLQLWVGWHTGSFDATEIAHFSLLIHFPQAYLLYNFYSVPILPLLAYVSIPTLSSYTAFSFFPRVASSPTSESSEDESLLTTLTTTLLASTLYALPLGFSLATWLPTHLAVHFTTLRTLELAHAATFVGIVLALLPAGYATQRLLFRPCISSFASTDIVPVEAFDAEAATFAETLVYNLKNLLFWRALPPQGREVIKRTALIAVWITAQTAFVAWATLDGFEHQHKARWGQEVEGIADSAAGLMGWAGVWGIGSVLSGVILGWVGNAW